MRNHLAKAIEELNFGELFVEGELHTPALQILKSHSRNFRF